jgi:hypothetical protein
LCWVGVHCGIYTGCYNVLNILHMNSPPPPFSFIPTPIQQVSFLHLHTCVHIFYTVFTLLYPSPITSPLPLVPALASWGRTCSVLLFYDFVEGKREKIKWKSWHFCLFKIKVTQGNVGTFLVIFPCIYMYCNPNWFYLL